MIATSPNSVAGVSADTDSVAIDLPDRLGLALEHDEELVGRSALANDRLAGGGGDRWSPAMTVSDGLQRQVGDDAERAVAVEVGTERAESPRVGDRRATQLSMNCRSDGTIRKNEMLIVDPGDSVGNRCPNRSATRAICSPLRITWHSPTP